jgi:hypothetical protein
MSAYAEQPRLRAEPMAPAASLLGLGSAQPSRLSIARRAALDLPLTAGAPAPQGFQGLAGAGNGHGHVDAGTLPIRSAEGDADLSSPLDIPAFLRRQEG